MILDQLLKQMIQLFQNIVERGTCFKYSIQFITCLLYTCRENQSFFKGANLRIFYSVEYCLGEAVLSNFKLAFIK